MEINTPYYLIDESKLLCNLEKVNCVRESTGAKIVLALKCFSAWSVFDLIKQYLDGTTGSSVYEVKLGHEEFGKENQAYSVGFSEDDVLEIRKYANRIIFNSVSQLRRFHDLVPNMTVGLRINPQISYSHFDLADPVRQYSRLGESSREKILDVLPLISGVLFHFNCDNDDEMQFDNSLDYICSIYGDVFSRLEWVSLGGGIYFTKDKYHLARFCEKIKAFGDKYNVQVYLEPGESVVTGSAELCTTVVDIVRNEVDIAIVDASIEAHMLDLLTYRLSAKLDEHGQHEYMIAGRSCLAGDIFGTYHFRSPLKVGDKINFIDAAGYTMVKKNWFNGLQMPSIVVKRIGGLIDVVRQFDYNDYKNNLS